MNAFEKLSDISRRLDANLENSELKREASRLLFGIYNSPTEARDIPSEFREYLFQQLLVSSFEFSHEAASNITSGNEAVVHSVCEDLASILRERLIPEKKEIDEDRGAVLFALVTRKLLGRSIDQSALKTRHIQLFPYFSPKERSLPYSVMFNSKYFGLNRKELLREYWPDEPSEKLMCLSPEYLLFFQWLKGRDAFTNDSELLSYLSKHLPGSQKPAASSLLLHSYKGSEKVPFDEWRIRELEPLLEERLGYNDYKVEIEAQKKRAFLQYRTYQVRSLIKNAIPHVRRMDRRPRVAVCVSGQLRGYKSVLDSWKQSLLPNIDATFFIHTWSKIGRSDAQPYRAILPFSGRSFPEAYRKVAISEGIDVVKKAYPTLFNELYQESIVSNDDIKSIYETEFSVVDDELEKPFSEYSNQEKMHYKIMAADALARNEGEFDLYVRIRPDLEIKNICFDWNDLVEVCKTQPVIFAEKSYGFHYGHLMIGDQFAVGASSAMRRYSETWNSQVNFSSRGLAGVPCEFTGHVSLAIACWLAGIAVDEVPIRFGGLQEASPMTSQEILRCVERDAVGNSRDNMLLDALRSDID